MRESIKGTVDMCSVPVRTLEPLERADGTVAVGAKVCHVLQAVHTEGDQAASVYTAEHRNIKKTNMHL